MKKILQIGTAEVDITPPVGTLLCGGIQPRVSKGIQDPLYAKAIVLESGSKRLAYVILDLCALTRREGDRAVKLAARRTGMPEECIVWAASHTHTGPYVFPFFGAKGRSVINEKWLAGVPDKIAESVARAQAAMQPAVMSRSRAYCFNVQHNRRLRFKDGREINTWLLNKGEDTQCISSAGPIDPEIGIISFEDLKGRMLAVMFHFTLHANTNFGQFFSGDYPAVVAARLAEKYGRGCSTFYLPGACGNINSIVPGYRNIGNIIADKIIDKLDGRNPVTGEILLGAAKREITVPYRDLDVDQEKRIVASQWNELAQNAFRKELSIMRKAKARSDKTILQAWRIGGVGFASVPGELFVEWGIKIKQESPFDWTYPVELGGDYIGYLVTEQAWKAGGYESLICRSARPSVEGVSSMVDNVLEMLGGLRAAGK